MGETYPKNSARTGKDSYSITYRNVYQNFTKSSINIPTSTAFSSSDRPTVKQTCEPTRILEKISLLILQSFNQGDKLETVLLEIRQALKLDRVLICRFNADGSEKIVAESVTPGLPEAINHQIEDPCYQNEYLEQHHSNVYSVADAASKNSNIVKRVHATNNIYEAGLTDSYIKTLEQFAVKANLVAPIISDNKLLGLLMAHQCSNPRQWQTPEIELFEQIATHLGFALGYAVLLEERQNAAKQAQLLTNITQSMRSSLKWEDILNTTVTEVRQALPADRVLVYRFQSDWSGRVVTESNASSCPQALDHQIDDSYFRERYTQLYRSGRVCAISNIYKAGLTPYHISNLERFGVKSKLIAPVLKHRKLFGLLIAHQCLSFREWQESEINFFASIATQVGFALEQAQLQEKMEQITQIATQSAFEIEQPAPENIEQIPRQVQILPEESDRNDVVAFAEFSWQE